MGETSSTEVAVKELRLGLVCYGGVSLAIYMHGITKELHKLAIASRENEHPSSKGLDKGTTEHAYLRLLKSIEKETGIRWRVVIDVISGTSAGGINGIYLAKALAGDLSQDGLRALWMEKGDIKKLLWGPRFAPKWLWLRFPIALGRALRKRGQGKPPFRGDLMCKWLLEALQKMQPRSGSAGTLVDEGGSLELFVTLTDFRGYPRYIPIRGLTIHDDRHRHVLAFTRNQSTGQDQFDGTHDRMLAFGARGTSSFPGAFAPISLADFDVYVGGSGDRKISKEFFRIYELADATANTTYFVDGGVLDNFPFEHTIDAIHRKPANTQVKRRLVYIEPHPAGLGGKDTTEQPGFLSTIWGGLSTIPADEPILDDLLRLRERNEKIEQIRDVIESREKEVAKELPMLTEKLPQKATEQDITEWNRLAHDAARKLTGSGYETYLQIKTASVVRAFADTLNCVADFPKESNEAVLVRRVAARWARGNRILGTDQTVPDESKRLEFLHHFDLPYAARRLRFIVDGVNQMYSDVGSDNEMRAELDKAKSALYELRSRFTKALAGRGLPVEITKDTLAVLDEDEVKQLAREENGPDRFMESHSDLFNDLAKSYRNLYGRTFESFGTTLYGRFRDITASWHDEKMRRRLLLRYIGFPIWDALIFPLVEVGDLGEIEPITIVRFSPNEAKKLSSEGAEGKLVGVGLHHFKAFFDRLGREKDYTWGRLDGTESIIALLMDEGDVEIGDDVYAEAFEAVFKEEKDLRGAGKLHESLKKKLHSLGS